MANSARKRATLRGTMAWVESKTVRGVWCEPWAARLRTPFVQASSTGRSMKTSAVGTPLFHFVQFIIPSRALGGLSDSPANYTTQTAPLGSAPASTSSCKPYFLKIRVNCFMNSLVSIKSFDLSFITGNYTTFPRILTEVGTLRATTNRCLGLWGLSGMVSDNFPLATSGRMIFAVT